MDINILLNQLAILFIMIFVGFGLNKAGILGKEIDGKLTKLVLQFTMPAMILASVLTNKGDRDTDTVLKIFLIAIVMYLLLVLLARIACIIFRIPVGKKGVYQFMFIFGNVGFMGFPMVNALFGSDAVLYAGIINIIFNFVSYSYGEAIVSKDAGKTSKVSFKTFISPGISVSVLSIILYFLNVKVPSFVSTPITYFGNMTTPLAMLLIGSTLAGMKFKTVFNDIRIYIFIVVRMLILPVALFQVTKLIIKDDFLLQFTLIMFTMPVANSSVLFAKRFGADEEFAARGVVLSTILSIGILPLVSYICL